MCKEVKYITSLLFIYLNAHNARCLTFFIDTSDTKEVSKASKSPIFKANQSFTVCTFDYVAVRCIVNAHFLGTNNAVIERFKIFPAVFLVYIQRCVLAFKGKFWLKWFVMTSCISAVRVA